MESPLLPARLQSSAAVDWRARLWLTTGCGCLITAEPLSLWYFTVLCFVVSLRFAYTLYRYFLTYSSEQGSASWEVHCIYDSMFVCICTLINPLYTNMHLNIFQLILKINDNKYKKITVNKWIIEMQLQIHKPWIHNYKIHTIPLINCVLIHIKSSLLTCFYNLTFRVRVKQPRSTPFLFTRHPEPCTAILPYLQRPYALFAQHKQNIFGATDPHSSILRNASV